jgi:hypothetical protein
MKTQDILFIIMMVHTCAVIHMTEGQDIWKQEGERGVMGHTHHWYSQFCGSCFIKVWKTLHYVLACFDTVHDIHKYLHHHGQSCKFCLLIKWCNGIEDRANFTSFFSYRFHVSCASFTTDHNQQSRVQAGTSGRPDMRSKLPNPKCKLSFFFSPFYRACCHIHFIKSQLMHFYFKKHSFTFTLKTMKTC